MSQFGTSQMHRIPPSINSTHEL